MVFCDFWSTVSWNINNIYTAVLLSKQNNSQNIVMYNNLSRDFSKYIE
jgi:hypothetical protein